MNDVKQKHPETKIEDHLEDECSKEKISIDEVIFFYYIPGIKELASTEKNSFYFVVPRFKAERLSLHLTKCFKRYSTELNLQSWAKYVRQTLVLV